MSNRPNPSRALRRFSKENSMPVLSPHALFEAHLNVSELSRSLPFIRRCLASNWPTVTRNVESLSSGSVDAGTRCSGATGRTVHQRRLWEPSLAVAYPMRSAGAFRKLLTVRKRRYLAPRLQLPHGVRTHFENGKSLIGEASLGECYDPLWPQFFHDKRPPRSVGVWRQPNTGLRRSSSPRRRRCHQRPYCACELHYLVNISIEVTVPKSSSRFGIDLIAPCRHAISHCGFV
jgi:hypothetical protein